MFYAGPLDFAGPASTSFRSTGGAAGTSYGALPQLDGTEDQADGAEDDSKVEEGEAGVEQADFGTLGTFYNPQAAGNTVEYYAQATEDVASSQHYDPIMGSASIMPIAAELAGIDGSESASASANRLLPIQSKALPPTAQVQYVHRPPAPPRIAPRLPTQTTRLILQARAAPAVIQQPVPVISSLYALPAARAPPRPPLPASAEADFGNVSYTTGGYGMDMSAPLEPTPDRPFIKVAHKSRVEISADSLQYSRPPPPPPPRLSDQYADSFGQQRGAQPTLPTPPMGRGSYIAQQQPFTSAGTGSTSRADRWRLQLGLGRRCVDAAGCRLHNHGRGRLLRREAPRLLSGATEDGGGRLRDAISRSATVGRVADRGIRRRRDPNHRAQTRHIGKHNDGQRAA